MDFVQSTNSEVFEIFYDMTEEEKNENMTEIELQLESNGLWILGKSFSHINISPKNETKCENFSCYEKSLKTNKICKPGIFKIYSMLNR